MQHIHNNSPKLTQPKTNLTAKPNFTTVISTVLITLFGLLLLVGTQGAIANTQESRSGELELMAMNTEGNSESTKNNKRSTLLSLQLDSKANISINGMVATIELEQHFQNPSDQWVEGRYVFPLPEGAAVNAMEILIGKRLIKATIKEKNEAQKIYKAAKAAGKKAALLEQHRPNLFSQKITTIGPKENIVVKLRYIQTIHYADNTFSLRFPMTITPRYIPSSKNAFRQTGQLNTPQENKQVIEDTAQDLYIDQQHGWGWAQNTTQVPDANLVTPPMEVNTSTEARLLNPIELTITLDAGLPLASIDSAYHSISVSKMNSQHSISLSKGKVSMDRDFVLSWQPVAATVPTAALFNETIDGDDYSLIMLMPPKQTATQQTIKKETIFIIDTSGSMGGTSIKQAKAGLAHALEQLHENDKFNIIEFNSDFSMLYSRPRIVNQDNINRALSFIGRLRADGGTEMLTALNAAFLQTHDDEYLKHIIFITDGSVGNETALFKSIHHQLGSARLFTVGIGAAPNSFFMSKAAEFGRGSFTYIGDVNEVKEKMQALFSKINNPSMRDITIEDAQGRPLEIFPKPIPDLYQGEPLLASIRKDYETNTLIIKGTYNKQPWQQSVSFNHGKNHKGIANIWARKKIEALLDQERTEGKNDISKQNILNVALRHQLMSPYTSFVAVEEIISRPSEQKLTKRAVPNLVAKGQQLQNVNYPQTATPLWLHIMLGLASMLAASILRFVKKTLPPYNQKIKFL